MRSTHSKQDTLKANRKAGELGHNLGRFRPIPETGGALEIKRCQNRGCVATAYWDNDADELGAYGSAFEHECPYKPPEQRKIGF